MSDNNLKFGFRTCGSSHGAQSAPYVRLWNEERPHSVSPASGDSPSLPTAAGPCVLRWALWMRTAASPRSSWPSSAGEIWRCGRTPRAAWVVCQCARTARPPRSGNLVFQTPWRLLLHRWQTDVWPWTQTLAAAAGSVHQVCWTPGQMQTLRQGPWTLSLSVSCVEKTSTVVISSTETGY